MKFGALQALVGDIKFGDQASTKGRFPKGVHKGSLGDPDLGESVSKGRVNLSKVVGTHLSSLICVTTYWQFYELFYVERFSNLLIYNSYLI